MDPPNMSKLVHWTSLYNPYSPTPTCRNVFNLPLVSMWWFWMLWTLGEQGVVREQEFVRVWWMNTWAVGVNMIVLALVPGRPIGRETLC